MSLLSNFFPSFILYLLRACSSAQVRVHFPEETARSENADIEFGRFSFCRDERQAGRPQEEGERRGTSEGCCSTGHSHSGSLEQDVELGMITFTVYCMMSKVKLARSWMSSVALLLLHDPLPYHIAKDATTRLQEGQAEAGHCRKLLCRNAQVHFRLTFDLHLPLSSICRPPHPIIPLSSTTNLPLPTRTNPSSRKWEVCSYWRAETAVGKVRRIIR
jgi:hypothetical protein